MTHSFSDYLDGSLSYTSVHNNEAAVLLRLDRRGYSDLNVNLTWRPLETLSPDQLELLWSQAKLAESAAPSPLPMPMPAQ